MGLDHCCLPTGGSRFYFLKEPAQFLFVGRVGKNEMEGRGNKRVKMEGSGVNRGVRFSSQWRMDPI